MSNRSYKEKQEKNRMAARLMCFILALAMLGGVAVYLFILIGGGF